MKFECCAVIFESSSKSTYHMWRRARWKFVQCTTVAPLCPLSHLKKVCPRVVSFVRIAICWFDHRPPQLRAFFRVGGRVPVDVCCVIDVSGSMSMNATLKDTVGIGFRVIRLPLREPCKDVIQRNTDNNYNLSWPGWKLRDARTVDLGYRQT